MASLEANLMCGDAATEVEAARLILALTHGIVVEPKREEPRLT